MKTNTDYVNPFESVRGVVFDVDGTLYSQPALRLRMVMRLLASAALRPKKLMAEWKMVSRFRVAQEILRRRGNQSPDLAREQLRMAVRKGGLDEEKVLNTVLYWMETVPLDHIPACARRNLPLLIEGLRRSGLKIGVFSDYPCEKKLRALGILPLVDAALCSTDESVGAFKPHPAGFRAAAERLGLDPAEVLYVGDRVEVDAEGAKAAGMKAAIVHKGALCLEDGVVFGSLESICAALMERK
jgi:HAD superfamily hydrolase (TIGR01509 family)